MSRFRKLCGRVLAVVERSVTVLHCRRALAWALEGAGEAVTAAARGLKERLLGGLGGLGETALRGAALAVALLGAASGS